MCIFKDDYAPLTWGILPHSDFIDGILLLFSDFT